ncbi:lactoylglutathione lyase [Olsenella profusa DSM 13989]|uniref:Glyoxalase-like domain protein n=1 Tax=Olsenella profusa F0195 TaxID=1125712 RepID=U2TRT4_9ACTN|nr:VOC family protein [Olsenella profusa]ERL08793.1 glyoxalase-like domain protein [Olsenella profusa F0195]MDP9860033.1 lactoylglutathione lyase [Olsenella profusa DSM 13989]
MNFRFVHRCTHVIDLEATRTFYERALGLVVDHVSGPADGSWSNTFMTDPHSGFQLELTWNRGRTEPYDNGGMDTHIAFVVDDFEAAHRLHEEMGCIQRENPAMGLYFICDPDGQYIEILPER